MLEDYTVLRVCLVLALSLTTAVCSGSDKKTVPEILTGTLESKSGIKHVINCHCSAGFIVTNAQGGMTWACFDSNPPEDCKAATLSGFYKVSNIKPSSPMDPCPAGPRTLFMVKSFVCQ